MCVMSSGRLCIWDEMYYVAIEFPGAVFKNSYESFNMGAGNCT